jgi:hypothetical protein
LSVAAFKMLDPFPPQVKRTLKYASTHTLATDATTGAFGPEQRYSLNSLYDPDVSGGGHQPYGFDQLFALYSKYRVDRVSWKITFTTPGATADMICGSAITPVSSGSSLATKLIYYVAEWPNTNTAHLSSSGARVAYITGTIDLWDLVGVSKERYQTDDIFCAANNASPSQVAYINYAVGSYSGSTSQACSTLIELSYEAVAYERIVQAAS